ncbi:MAG: phosphatase PAP2 family protein [Ferruginibacter sp.]
MSPRKSSCQCSTPPNSFNDRYGKICYQPFIIPAFAVAYGIISLNSPDLKKINRTILQDIRPTDLSKKQHLDNYLQYTPGAISLGMTALGVKGNQNMRDATLTYASINIISSAIVTPIKKITHEQRPDSSNFLSFPSGHTAEAFANAEFLRMQYGKKYPWLAVVGYAMATATGYLRMYNNKHWFSDVLTGAAIGFCSARLGGWLYAKLQPNLFPAPNISQRGEPVF